MLFVALALGLLLGLVLGWLIWGRRPQGDSDAQALFQALGRLEKSVEALHQRQENAWQVAQRLEQALKLSPGIRGRWGEVQLRRLVEMAGMARHVDFVEQATTEAGRPDMVIWLPDGGAVPVDAKTPLQHYLTACEMEDGDARKEALRRHAEAVKQRVRDLAGRNYWEGISRSSVVALTVLYLPVEPALAAAFEWEPRLFEDALEKRVLLATPVTLLALLEAIAYGWRQRQASEHATRLMEAARELHSRFDTFCRHLADLGKRLGEAVDRYNRAVGSLEQRLMPHLRKLQEMGVVSQTPQSPPALEQQPRAPLLPLDDGQE